MMTFWELSSIMRWVEHLAALQSVAAARTE